VWRQLAQVEFVGQLDRRRHDGGDDHNAETTAEGQARVEARQIDADGASCRSRLGTSGGARRATQRDRLRLL
jgi:hypothetical protein